MLLHWPFSRFSSYLGIKIKSACQCVKQSLPFDSLNKYTHGSLDVTDCPLLVVSLRLLHFPNEVKLVEFNPFPHWLKHGG